MEKRAVISPDITPVEHDDQQLPNEKKACIRELDADLRKRLADTAAEKNKEV